MEEEAEQYFEKIDALGGVIAAIEQGFFQREIAEAAYHRYLSRGDSHGCAFDDWLEAELELRQNPKN